MLLSSPVLFDMPEEEEEKSGAEREEFKVFVRWDDPEEDDEDEGEGRKGEEGEFGWVPLIEAFGSMASGDVFQVFLPGASDPLSRGAEEVWVWQQTSGESGKHETFWDAIGPFTKKDATRLSREIYPPYIDIDDEALIHGLLRYFQELRKLRAAKKATKIKGEVKEENDEQSGSP
jgi:hypothetical protein